MDRYCRICRNTSCSNHGKNITFIGEGWKCNYIPVPTNADRIRAMSDKEIAKLLVDAVSIGCPFKMDWSCEKEKDGWDACDACWCKWLKQPAE